MEEELVELRKAKLDVMVSTDLQTVIIKIIDTDESFMTCGITIEQWAHMALKIDTLVGQRLKLQ